MLRVNRRKSPRQSGAVMQDKARRSEAAHLRSPSGAGGMTFAKALQSKTATVIALAAVVLCAVTALRVWDPPPVAQLRERSFDIYQHIQPRIYGDFPVRVVDIDEASLAQFGQSPWPRSFLAQFLQRLNDLGAAVIALDMVFPEPDRTSPQRMAGSVGITDPAQAERIKGLLA